MYEFLLALGFSVSPLTLYIPTVRRLNPLMEAVENFFTESGQFSVVPNRNGSGLRRNRRAGNNSLYAAKYLKDEDELNLISNPQEMRLRSGKRCLRCSILYLDEDNSPMACCFHGHVTGEKGLYSLAPPHQGIDGEWTDGSGVIVYKWNEKNNRPNTGRINWKKRWTCCAEYNENAQPCRHGWHVSYDDGFTLY